MELFHRNLESFLCQDVYGMKNPGLNGSFTIHNTHIALISETINRKPSREFAYKHYI